MGAAKILVVGSVNGQLKKAITKIAKLHAKQNFSLALIVGDVFVPDSEASPELDELLEGSIQVPLPTYFSVGNNDLPGRVIKRLAESDNVCPNLIYLGRRSTFTSSEGIRIVSLGGQRIDKDSLDDDKLGRFEPLFLDQDAKTLHGAKSAHILLTNQWPASVTKLSCEPLPENIDPVPEAQCIANLCLELKPWYHFSSSPPASWEREPFRHPIEYGSLEEATVTRFRSLASVDASSKEWMSAFSIDTERPPPAPQATEQPFLRSSPSRKRAMPQDQNASYGRHADPHGFPRKSKRAKHYDPNDCFMCMNRPEFREHLVASIGNESIVTALRGPLPLIDTFPLLSFSGHAIIIPLYHAADELAHGKRPAEEVKNEFDEMTRYRKALSDMIGTKSKGSLGTVCWEVNRTGIRHFHWQLLAAKAEQIRKGLITAAFKVAAEKQKLPTFEQHDPDKQVQQRSDFFRVWLWAPSADPVEIADKKAKGESRIPGQTQSLYFPLPANQSFNIWFGREVMAGILQLEDRVNWMHTLSANEKEETEIERRDADGLKQDFENFDFAMQDG